MAGGTMKSITVFLLFNLFLLGGCIDKHMATNTQPNFEKELRSRVSDYVKAKKSEDLETEYTFLSPDYKKKYSFIQFVQSRKNKVEDLALKEIKYENNSDTAIVILDFSMNLMGKKIEHLPIEQEWILIDGVWYFNANPSGFEQLFMPKKSFRK